MIVIGKPRISNGVLYLDEVEFAKCEIRDGIYYYGRKEPFLMGLTKRDFYDPEEHNIQVVFDSIEDEGYTFVLVEDKRTEFPLSQQEIDWIQHDLARIPPPLRWREELRLAYSPPLWYNQR